MVTNSPNPTNSAAVMATPRAVDAERPTAMSEHPDRPSNVAKTLNIRIELGHAIRDYVAAPNSPLRLEGDSGNWGDCHQRTVRWTPYAKVRRPG